MLITVLGLTVVVVVVVVTTALVGLGVVRIVVVVAIVEAFGLIVTDARPGSSTNRWAADARRACFRPHRV
jgi:hypothetical protein